jgi:hypothetical protein
LLTPETGTYSPRVPTVWGTGDRDECQKTDCRRASISTDGLHISQRIKMTDKHVFEDFIYLTAMMKSCSSLMWAVLSAIQQHDNRAKPEKLQNISSNDFMPMSLEYRQKLPVGTVFKNHAPLEYHNNYFLKETGCKYVVLIRHPADQLVAFYCHTRGLFREKLQASIEQQASSEFAIGQYPLNVVTDDPHAAISSLIECGYLLKSLIWIADWIAFRHHSQSRLLRYEDIVGDFHAVVAQLCWFIRGRGPDEDLMDYLLHVFDHELSEGQKKNNLEKYPFGWTGRAGIWRDYFSEENISNYNEVINSWKKLYPPAEHVFAAYPDLKISI